jgi:hypothetical protein
MTHTTGDTATDDMTVRHNAAQPQKTRSRGNPWGPRGFRGRAGGSWPLLPTPPTFRGTSAQVCGWWPFSAASTRPDVGVPVGADLHTGATVCCDPFAWFRAGLISSPSMLVLGMPGLGKSSFACRQIVGLADRGVVPLVAGDLKPDYANTIAALGGQVISLGAGQRLNVLDQAGMHAAADRIGGQAATVLREQAVVRAATMVAALVQVIRRSPLADWEAGLLTRTVRTMTTAHRERGLAAPTLPELAALLRESTAEMITGVLAADAAEYTTLTAPLHRSLAALLDGPLGTTFAGQTTTRIDPATTGVCVDISAAARQSEEYLAAVMLATWSETFATVEAANALADAGLAPQRHFLTVIDEMWRPMRLAGAGLVDKLDAITRLNRSEGVGHIFVTHTLKDLESMDSAAETRKARGFAERSAITVTAGLAREDLHALSEIRRLSAAEIDTVASWSTPPGWRPRVLRSLDGSTRPAPPPGAGRVLIKIGQRPGIATQVVLTDTELALHDTNTRWTTKVPEPLPPADTAPRRRGATAPQDEPAGPVESTAARVEVPRARRTRRRASSRPTVGGPDA